MALRLWAKCLTEQRIVSDTVREYPMEARPADPDGWSEILTDLCRQLDLSRPVLMKKHVRELLQFNRAVFYPQDFMESVDFERFEIEIFPEKKKDRF